MKLKKVTVVKANSYTDNYIVKIDGKELPNIYGCKTDMLRVAAANRKVLRRLAKAKASKK